MIITFLLFGNDTSSAQNNYNVFANQTFEFNQNYQEILPEISYLKQEVHINCFQLTNKSNRIYQLINEKALELCKLPINKEEAYLKIRSQFDQKLQVYRELLYSKNSMDRNYENNEISLPILKEVKAQLTSVFDHKLIFEIQYQFVVKSSLRYSRNDENEIELSSYYIADLQTGEVMPWKIKLDESQLESVQKLISNQLNENYSMVTSKLKQSEIDLLNEEEDAEENKIVCKDICTRMNLREADIIPFGWGILFRFQNFTTSSKVFQGKSFQVFLSFEEVKNLYQIIPALGFLKNVKQPMNSMMGFNFYEVLHQVSQIRIPIEIVDVLELNEMKKAPKSLVLKSYQIYENGKSWYRGSMQYELNAQGKVLSKSWTDENNRVDEQVYNEYDIKGNILKSVRKMNRSDEESESYNYDRKMNLISKKRWSSNELNFENIFYNGEFMYLFKYSFFRDERNDVIQKIQNNKSSLCLDDVCYLFNEHGKVKGVTAKQYVFNQIQISRDSNDKLIESHLENERYNYYHYYDTLGRFIRYECFEYQKPISIVSYTYSNDSMLPKQQNKLSLNSGNRIMEKEEYEWEYFE